MEHVQMLCTVALAQLEHPQACTQAQYASCKLHGRLVVNGYRARDTAGELHVHIVL
jgi:hypothetical protein